MNFEVLIGLGNEAMQTGNDVATALETIAASLRSIEMDEPFTEQEPAVTVRDLNGNTVGYWRVRY